MVGSTVRRLAPLLFFALVLLTVTVSLSRTRSGEAACAFTFAPVTYEDLKNRQLFLTTIELAAANLLFPGDPYFGLPALEAGPRTARTSKPGNIPPSILKSIGWIESGITQAGVNVPFGSIGPALVSFDCGHGVAQVTSGMTVPTGEVGRGSPEQALVATHFAYNIARGAVILASKWNDAPELRPIAGTDTNGEPLVLENWYFAVWSYNGFTGPGANRSNHPLDPIYGVWPRPAYSCGNTGQGKSVNRANYPYQELVFGCSASPPVVDGQLLWQPVPISLPDLNNPAWRNALRLENFIFPYSAMDMPSPQPIHADTSQPPNAGLRVQVLGSPQMQLSNSAVRIGVNGSSATTESVQISNAGTGVLPWYAVANVPWLKITPYTGGAVGANLPCATGVPCERNSKLEITVDMTKAPAGRSQAQVVVKTLGSNQQQVITVEVVPVIRLGVPGVTRN